MISQRNKSRTALREAGPGWIAQCEGSRCTLHRWGGRGIGVISQKSLHRGIHSYWMRKPPPPLELVHFWILRKYKKFDFAHRFHSFPEQKFLLKSIKSWIADSENKTETRSKWHANTILHHPISILLSICLIPVFNIIYLRFHNNLPEQKICWNCKNWWNHQADISGFVHCFERLRIFLK